MDLQNLHGRICDFVHSHEKPWLTEHSDMEDDVDSPFVQSLRRRDDRMMEDNDKSPNHNWGDQEVGDGNEGGFRVDPDPPRSEETKGGRGRPP